MTVAAEHFELRKLRAEAARHEVSLLALRSLNDVGRSGSLSGRDAAAVVKAAGARLGLDVFEPSVHGRDDCSVYLSSIASVPASQVLSIVEDLVRRHDPSLPYLQILYHAQCDARRFRDVALAAVELVETGPGGPVLEGLTAQRENDLAHSDGLLALSDELQRDATCGELGARQGYALAELLRGASMMEAAHAAGVHRATLWRWCQDAIFAEEYERRRRELADAAQAQLLAAAGEAARVVVRAMRDPEDGALRLRAAALLLSGLGVLTGERRRVDARPVVETAPLPPVPVPVRISTLADLLPAPVNGTRAAHPVKGTNGKAHYDP